MATKIGLPAFCVAATAVNSAERRESMIEVLLAFNVVVLQRAMDARSHKLLGTHQLSVCESVWGREKLLGGRPLENCAVVIGRNFDQHCEFQPVDLDGLDRLFWRQPQFRLRATRLTQDCRSLARAGVPINDRKTPA